MAMLKVNHLTGLGRDVALSVRKVSFAIPLFLKMLGRHSGRCPRAPNLPSVVAFRLLGSEHGVRGTFTKDEKERPVWRFSSYSSHSFGSLAAPPSQLDGRHGPRSRHSPSGGGLSSWSRTTFEGLSRYL